MAVFPEVLMGAMGGGEVVTGTVAATNTTTITIPYDGDDFPKFLYLYMTGTGMLSSGSFTMVFALPTVPQTSNPQIAMLWFHRFNVDGQPYESRVYLGDFLTSEPKMTIDGNSLVLNMGVTGGATWNYSSGYFYAYGK